MANDWWSSDPVDNSSAADAWWAADPVAPAKEQKKPEEPGLLDRARQGLASTTSAAQISATDDPARIAELVAKEQATRLPPTATQQKMAEEVKPLQAAYQKAEGLDAVGAFASLAAKRLAQFATNPRELAGAIVENLPNSAPGMAAGLTGGYVGAAAGSLVAPGVGTAIGGVTGSVAGGTAGGYLVEQGAAMRDQVLKAAQELGIDPKDPKALEPLIREKYDQFLEASRLKGIGTAGTDAALNALTLGIAGAGERVLAKEARALTEGVTSGAVNATEGAAKLAEIEAKQAARNTLGAKAARGTGIISAEMAGEGLSEAAGQKLAYGQVDALDVIDESILGLGQGASTAAGRGVYNRAIGAPTGDTVDKSISFAQDALAASRQRQALAEQALQAAPDAATAAAAANELASSVDEFTSAVDAYLNPGAPGTPPTGGAPTSPFSTDVDMTPPDTMRLAQLRARMDREMELQAQAEAAGTEFERRMAKEQAEATRPAPRRVPNFVDLMPMNEQQAGQRLRVLSDMMTNEGQDASTLAVVPHPGQPGAFAIARQTPAVQAAPTAQPDVSPQEANTRLEAAAVAGLEAPTAPRPSKINGTPAETFTDEQLTQIAGNESLPAISRRGASVELNYRQAEQAAQAPAAEPTGIVPVESRARPLSIEDQVAARQQENALVSAEMEQRAQADRAQAERRTQEQIAATSQAPALPPAGDVIQALVTPGLDRTTEQTTLIRQAESRYSPEDFSILQRAASGPFQLNSQERFRLREMRQASAAQVAPVAANAAPVTAGPVKTSTMPSMAPQEVQGRLEAAAQAAPVDSTQARLEAAAQTGRLANATGGRVITSSAKFSTQRPLAPGVTSTLMDGDLEHEFTVVDPSKLGVRGRLMQQVARIFGKRVVVFDSDTLRADGFVLDNDDRTVFLNSNSQMSPLAVLGHETTHLMKRDNPGAYAALRAVVERELKDGALEAYANETGAPDIEELISDLTGDRFQEPEFWQSVFDEIEAQNPQEAKGIISRLTAAITRAINAFLKVVRQPGYNAGRYVNDLEAVKRAITQAVATYAQQQRAPAQALERGEQSAVPQTTDGAPAEATFSAVRRGGTAEDIGEFKVRTQKDGSMGVAGDVEQIRALLPEGVKGRPVPGGLLFTTSDAPRVRAALEGRKLAYSRGGQVLDKLPMKDGKYVGAPEKYNTPAKIAALRKSLRKLTREGERGRYWYENSSREVLRMVGGNVQEARKFVALLAIYSPQAKVDSNSTFALRAWAQYKAGQPISVKTAVQDNKAQAALDNVDAFWSGEKTGNFFFNLLREIDPTTEGKQGATIDMWMMRAGEYANDKPTDTQYAFMENETNRIAQEFGWEPQQVQAAIWVAMKARMENAGVKKRTEDTSEKKGWIRFDYPLKDGKPTKTRVILNAQAHRDNWLKHAMAHEPTEADTSQAKFDFADGLRRHIGQLSWEARPGRSTNVLPGVNDASYERQVEFQQAVQKALLDDDGIDLLAYKLGLLVDGPDILAPGVWQGEIAAGMQKQVALAPGKGDDSKSLDVAQRGAIETYAAMLGLLLRQEGVGYHRPFFNSKMSAANGMDINVGRTFTPNEAQALWGALDERMRAAGVADWESGAGLISTPTGMRVVNFGALPDNGNFRALVKDAATTLLFDELKVGAFASDGDLVFNDWKENPNGESYRSRIVAGGPPDLLRWAGSVLAPRVQAVFDEFSSRYGWGDPGRTPLLDEAAEAREEVTPKGQLSRQRDYEQDLFGKKVSPPKRTRARASTGQAGVAGDVLPAAEVLGDTPAPEGEYFARTIVGNETQRKLGADRIKDRYDAAAATTYLYRSAVERFDGLVTDKDGTPLGVVGGFKGELASASVFPGTLVAEAVRIPGAAKIWFSHNHPSGKAAFSNADLNLNRTLADVFRGSGIEPMGLLAIGDGMFDYVGPNDRQSSSLYAIPAPTGTRTVPAIEREIASNARGPISVSSPSDARAAAKTLYEQAQKPGLLLMDNQHNMTAWVPLPENALGRLRDTGGLNALYRAVSESNAGSAVIIHGGELDQLVPGGDVTLSQNIAAALSKANVRPLDSINASTGESVAERGLDVARGPVFSRQRVTDTPAFKRWFGDSLVVDKNGEPLVVYHGTTSDISEFDPNVSTGLNGSGIYLTSSPDEASAYAKTGGSQANVMPVYVSIKNPIRVGGRQKTVFSRADGSLQAFVDAFKQAASEFPAVPGSGVSYMANDRFALEASRSGRDALSARDVIDLVDSQVSLNGGKNILDADPQKMRLLRRAFEILGYDGIIDDGVAKRSLGKMEGVEKGTRHFIAFRPEQIKSATGNSGAFDATNPRITASRQRTPLGFYSALAEGVDNLQTKTAPAAGWKDAIKGLVNKGLVKADEVEWSGVNDWLDMQKGKVTRDQVADYLKQGGVRVEETVLGGTPSESAYERAIKEWMSDTDAEVREEDGKFIASYMGDDIPEEFATEAQAWAALRREARSVLEDMDVAETKYDEYTLPGGKNYREVLLTLPQSPEVARLKQKRDALEATSSRDPRYVDFTNRINAAQYRSSHWDEPNVLAHIRVNDRTDADGKRVLFVEELQSDWGQQGREKGFEIQDPQSTKLKREELQAELARLDEERNRVAETDRVAFDELSARMLDTIEQLRGLQPTYSKKVPIAPFVTKTEGWLNLALKRVITMAAEEGYDRVAFVNGEQSAERYDLSKQIESLEYDPKDEWLTAYPHDSGRPVIDQAVERKDLADMVGKEVAERIERGIESSEYERGQWSVEEDSDPDTDESFYIVVNPNGDPVYAYGGDLERFNSEQAANAWIDENAEVGKVRLEGLDLKVGGEGMKTFYDQIVPAALKKLLPKVGGGKLDSMMIPTGEPEWKTFPDGIERRARNKSKHPGFDVTDAMRAKVGEGLPLFSRRRNIYGQQVPASWTAPTDTKIDDVIYTMQDKLIDTKRVVSAIKAAAGNIVDKWNPYLQEELYHGRTAKQTADFLTDELRPLMESMQARNVSMDEFEEYLHNRHAEERNEQIAKVNPAMPDGGSGIDTADARAYLAALDPTKRRAFEALARRVDAITSGTRQLLVSSGLETQDTIDNWERSYSQYVPLNREDLDFATSGSGSGTGQGYSVRGSSSKRATGSSRAVVDILANVAMQRERAIVRAEKNRVATALYGLAVTQPNTDFWLAVNPDAIKDPVRLQQELIGMGLNPIDAQNIIEEPTQSYIDPRTGLVTQRVNTMLRSSPNVMAVRVNGADRYVFFNANDERSQRMAAALKNLDADQLGRVMSMAGKVTRYFASVNTQYNPIFGIVNLTRDTQGALLNLTTTPIADRKAEVLGNVMPALRGIYSDLRSRRAGSGPATGVWASLWEEFQKEGGQTGYRDQFSKSDERAKALQTELKRIREGKVKQAGRAVFNWLSDYNETLENAVRLSAYKAAKDKGMSNQQAASVAKNLTVNFNRKGQVATQAGALYAFFNAAVQGTARLGETLRGPAGKKIVAGGLLLGSAQALLLAAAGFDDDEPPDFVRERNLIIPTGGSKYVSIPLPLGLHVIPNTSRVLTEWAMSGWRNPAKRIGQITGALVDAFNPIGNAGWSAQTLAPTIADPIVALSENRDWTGKPIAKEDRSSLDPTPGYTRAKDTASWFSKELSYFLNLATGGTKYKPGALSPTPDQLDYLIGQATGGVGRELQKAEQIVTSAVTGEELPPYKVPLLGRFVGDTQSASADANRFYGNLTRINEHENEIKGRRKNREDVAQYVQANPEAQLVNLANRTEADVQKLNQRKREMLERGASKESIRIIETQISSRMKRLNEQVKQVQAR